MGKVSPKIATIIAILTVAYVVIASLIHYLPQVSNNISNVSVGCAGGAAECGADAHRRSTQEGGALISITTTTLPPCSTNTKSTGSTSDENQRVGTQSCSPVTGNMLSTTTTAGCINHAQCSQACTSDCPQSVYGCCSGCNIGHCNLQTGQCYCSSSAYYCGVNASLQVGQPCIYTTTTTSSVYSTANNPFITGSFTENSFSCSQVTGGNYCGLNYNNGLENSAIIVVLFTNFDGDVVTNAVMYAQQGTNTNGALFYCSSFPAGTYYASWKVYNSGDNDFTDATAWSAVSDRQQFIC